MPYIIPEERPLFDDHIISLEDGLITEGELNYVISSIVHNWIQRKPLSYSRLNSAIGVLDCAKMELYRQIAAPYEDKKKDENGSVSELDK